MRLFSIYNLLILNYGLIWFLMTINVDLAYKFFIVVWMILVMIKVFQKLIIAALFSAIKVIFPILLPIIAIISLIMLLSVFAHILENWFLILVGVLLYYCLFMYPVVIHNWYLTFCSAEISHFLSGLTGISLVSLSAYILQRLGFEKKNIETVFLNLPVFIVAIFVGMAIQSTNSSDN